MSQPFAPGENFSPNNSVFLESAPAAGSGLSAQFFQRGSSSPWFDNSFRRNIDNGASGSELIFDNPFSGGVDKSTPLLQPEVKTNLAEADSLQFSTPIDNQAAGATPDFRLVVGTDGKLRLEPTSNGNPLSDGKLNIEIDPGNKSLIEAINNADKNLKEYIREMMSYWVRNHPGQDYPSWWQDILASEPQIPNNAAPVPVEKTPPEFCPQPSAIPEPPAPPQAGWQPDYRSGSGQGYGRPQSESYYHGGGNGSAPDYALPNEVPDFTDSTGFIDRLSKTIMQNEGALNANGTPGFEAYNADDNGGISVGLRQWHAGGALPELLNAWQEKNPQKFQEYFQGDSPAQINAMSASEFASHPDLVQGMKSALSDTEYQGVQSQLLNDWVKREVKQGMDLGLTGEKEIATFVDIANQYGQDSANRAGVIGRAAGDQGREMNASVRGDNYAQRFAVIDANFSSDKALLAEKTPEAGEFGHKLAQAVKNWDEQMPGTGNCASAVQRALKDVGMPQFVGSGNAWDMLSPLERSGLFVRVPESQAAVGDLIVRPPSQNPAEHSIYGDISVVTARHGNTIIQTNDASYEYVHDNPRYDGKAVFLRHVSDKAIDKSENGAQKSGAESSAGHSESDANKSSSNSASSPSEKEKHKTT